MRRTSFNRFMPPVDLMQPRAVRRDAIATWLREQLLQGPVWPAKIVTNGKTRGYTLHEICSALTAIGGERNRAGEWTLSPQTATTAERTPSTQST